MFSTLVLYILFYFVVGSASNITLHFRLLYKKDVLVIVAKFSKEYNTSNSLLGINFGYYYTCLADTVTDN